MTCGHLNSMCFHIFSLDSSCFFLLAFFLKKKIFYFKWNAFIRSSSVVHWFRMNCFLVLDTHTFTRKLHVFVSSFLFCSTRSYVLLLFLLPCQQLLIIRLGEFQNEFFLLHTFFSLNRIFCCSFKARFLKLDGFRFNSRQFHF